LTGKTNKVNASKTITIDGVPFVPKSDWDALCLQYDEWVVKRVDTEQKVVVDYDRIAKAIIEGLGQSDSKDDEIAKWKTMYEDALAQIARLKQRIEQSGKTNANPTPEGWPYVWPKIGDLPKQPIWTYPDGYRWVPENNKIWCGKGEYDPYFDNSKSTGELAADAFAEIFGLKPTKKQG
jgi:hypothetical protein